MKTMFIKQSILILCSVILLISCSKKKDPKHLLILSGQSNMARMMPNESFTPAIATEFGKENIIVVKDAHGGQPIRRWYKAWTAPEGSTFVAEPDLYDSLLYKVEAAITKENIASVTFIWMQGERDARESLGDVYEQSLIGLHEQLSNDLNRTDVNFVIGRLSDFDMSNRRYPHWTMIREIQEKVGDSRPRFGWIDTDDMNDGVNRSGVALINDLHMSQAGYLSLGQEFAKKSIELTHKHHGGQE